MKIAELGVEFARGVGPWLDGVPPGAKPVEAVDRAACAEPPRWTFDPDDAQMRRLPISALALALALTGLPGGGH